jgi:hypothetical protein
MLKNTHEDKEFGSSTNTSFPASHSSPLPEDEMTAGAIVNRVVSFLNITKLYATDRCWD